MTKPTIHLIAPFHTVPAARYSHCAFTGKTLRFSKMMRMVGYKVVEYANEGSESEANEKVPILSEKDFAQSYAPLGPTDHVGRDAIIGSAGWNAFHAKLETALQARIQQGDIVAHPFGKSHEGLRRRFMQAIHVETGVGYEDLPWGAWRIFESEAWRHYHWGRDLVAHRGNDGLNTSYSWVIPNYFDAGEWPVVVHPYQPGKGYYVLYMNRIHPCKGLLTMGQIIQAWDARHPDDRLRFVFAGQGDFGELARMLGPDLTAKRTTYLGSLTGAERAEWAGHAQAMMMPTNFIEPFGGSGVEGMLCGTPLLASDWGAFTETIQSGVNGHRCKVLVDWIRALERVGWLDRATVAAMARERYTLEPCAVKYDEAFRQLGDLYGGKGWTELRRLDRVNPGEFTTKDPGPIAEDVDDEDPVSDQGGHDMTENY